MTLKWISGRWIDGWMNHAKYLYWYRLVNGINTFIFQELPAHSHHMRPGGCRI